MRQRLFTLALSGVLVASVTLPAQNPPPAGATSQGQRGTGPAVQGQRGRGGRPQVMTLSTTAWPDGGTIPVRYSQAGDEVSPPLSWSGAPEGTVSFVVMAHDVDAAIGTGLDSVLHWLVWNIPAAATSLPEGVPQGGQLADGSRQTSATGPNYRGPAAPASGAPHHYLFEVFALDVTLNVPAGGASPTETRAAILSAMAGHVRAKGTMVGLFRRAG